MKETIPLDVRRSAKPNKPWGAFGPERIEDALRRDTAAPSMLGLGVSCSVSTSGVRKLMPGVPLVDLV